MSHGKGFRWETLLSAAGCSGGIDADDDHDDSFVSFRQAQIQQLALALRIIPVSFSG